MKLETGSLPHFLIHLLMVGCALLVSTSFTVCAAIAYGMTPELLTFFRFLLASVLLAPFVGLRYGLGVSFRGLLRYAIISLALVFFFWAMFLSLRYTSALNTSVLFTLVPSISGFYAFFLIRERLGRARLVALGCGVVGAIWVIFRGDLSLLMAMQWNRGDLIFLAGCFGMALYTPLIKLLHRGEPMAKMTFWVLATGSVWLFLISAHQFGSFQADQVEPIVWLGIGYLAIFTTIITFFLTKYATIRLGSTTVMSYSYLYPLFVVLIEFFLGHGLPEVRIWPGVLITLVAMMVILRGERSAGVSDTRKGP